jgi:hypothetical protein
MCDAPKICLTQSPQGTQRRRISFEEKKTKGFYSVASALLTFDFLKFYQAFFASCSQLVWIIGILIIRICFEFRISSFGFGCGYAALWALVSVRERA